MQNIVDVIRAKSKIVNHVDIGVKYREDIEAKIGKKIPEEIVQRYDGTDYNFATIEVHPTNLCNQKCWFCSYKSRHTNQKLTWHQLEKVRDLKPKTITLVGGGDPTLYSDGMHNFNDIVLMYSNSATPIELGVISNGVITPPRDWQSHVKWIRVSLDASNKETYHSLKNTDDFSKVIKNIEDYVKGPIPIVGVGFLAQKRNIENFASFLYLCYQLDAGTKKVNVQQRPIHGFPEEIPTLDQLTRIVEEVSKITEKDASFGEFVSYQTNFHKIANAVKDSKSPWRQPKTPKSSACYFSLLFALLNAQGDIYPCRVMSEDQQMKIGHIDEPIKTILERRIELFRKIKPSECTECCRDDGNNLSLEQALIEPSIIEKASKHKFI